VFVSFCLWWQVQLIPFISMGGSAYCSRHQQTPSAGLLRRDEIRCLTVKIT
jgi:hypothetical protein